ALDNNDSLVPNNSVMSFTVTTNTNNTFSVMAKGASWCLGDPHTDAAPTNIENGALFQYNRNIGIYHCPADRSTIEDPNGVATGLTRFRSYNMSQSVNGNPDAGVA